MHGQAFVVEYGKTFTFTTSNRAADGTALVFTPAYFDLIDTRDGTVVIANEALVQVGSRALWRGTVETSQLVTDQTSVLASYVNYAIVVKEDTNANPTTFLHYHVQVTGRAAQSVERILGASGENMVIDLYVYDAGNNLLSCRQRLFDNADDASAATIDISPMEPGEIARYAITQTFSSGLQLRLSHKSVREE